MQKIEAPNGWYIACPSKEIQNQPVRKTLVGEPIVFFRDPLGKVVALEDRCPHRGVPLSQGQLTEKGIQCAYHGWEFNFKGDCIRIPGLERCEPVASRKVLKFSTIESQGFVWFQKGEEKQSPYLIPYLEDKRYATIHYTSRLETTLFDALENALDVPHTAILHKGLFRREEKTKINVTILPISGGVEARYEGELRPSGWLAKWIARKSTIEHSDRFILPSIAQVEYKSGDDLHILSHSFFTPGSEGEVLLHAVASFRLKVPKIVVNTVAVPLAQRILAQDAEILRKQFQNKRGDVSNKMAFSGADILGPSILKILEGKGISEKRTQELVL